jgi:hypothetical protein
MTARADNNNGNGKNRRLQRQEQPQIPPLRYGMTNKRTGNGNNKGSGNSKSNGNSKGNGGNGWVGGLFLADGAWSDVCVFGCGWVDVAEIVFRGVGLDSGGSGAGGCRVVAAGAGWLGAWMFTGLLLLDGIVGVRCLLLVHGLRSHTFVLSAFL